MLSHAKVWAAIDALASYNEMTPSGLAKRAGLDPTTFNRSKRFAGDGRPRWPSTESLAKILEATGESLKSFAGRVEAPEQRPSTTLSALPVAGFSNAHEENAFDTTGRPTGEHWETIVFPTDHTQNIFALEVSGDALLPLYREGDLIVVAPSAAVRRGDRIVLKPLEGGLAVYTLLKRTPKTLQVQTIGDNPEKAALLHSAIEWTARIIWASQ
ncbi:MULTISPECIES: helix-turn-helix transcriptional regulator [unclassified Roseibium]|uniref:S24 family peptidase n=1 Tax=unclassified Roseibium TaxID=2629323 RepID=UPI00273D58B0|nr:MULTISPECIES: helix-turn-helix transcriptional regulator [unclassified Roseibium]